MGHGHEEPYKIPDYKTFKVTGCAKLEELEDALAKRGLKDPWIRNEAWRYHPGFGTKLGRIKNFFFRGFGIGLVLTVLTVGAEKAIGSGGHDNHADGHGHH